MKVSLFALVLFAFFSTCQNDQKRLANEQNIIGDWKMVQNQSNGSNIYRVAPAYDISGFSFENKNKVDNKSGYFMQRRDTDIYLGETTNYRLTADSLMIFNLVSKRWDSYGITQLNKGTLILNHNNVTTTFKRIQVKQHTTIQFDKIILSSSGCFGSCPVMDIIINSDNTVLFKGVSWTNKEGVFGGVISSDQFAQIEGNFNKNDFNQIDSSYAVAHTDDETISTTFVKDGKIYKTVNDYGRAAPLLFVWSYTPLRYLYTAMQLKTVFVHNFLDSIYWPSIVKLCKGDSVLELKQSESFLLFEYLRMGKIVNNNFKPRFTFELQRFSSSGKLNTDGRYYTFFINGRAQTIDIGFNFYDVNINIWHLRKKSFID